MNEPTCKGSWRLGTACGKCKKCKDTRPTEKLKTCARCVHLEFEMIGNTRVYGCNKTGHIVPHASNRDEATFWRVPMECPLPDTEVEKRETRAKRCEWEKISER